jgi:L-lactate dehydrogenase complex protein LldG
MSSRDKILAAIKQNQPGFAALPEIENHQQSFTGLVEKFTDVLRLIGGNIYEVANIPEAIKILQSQFGNEGRFISLLKSFEPFATFYNVHESAHLLENVEVAVISAQFAVAENGSVWITDDLLPTRVLPFICQHLVVLVNKNEVVSTMHDAYDIIGKAGYGFGTFIAGPSKTADIEQSLVLGAHGPKTMTVFLVE